MNLEVISIGQEEALSVFKPNHTKEITTTSQWLSAFTIYAAVLTEHSPQHASGLFKHIADITEMARRFGGLAWDKYDQSFRKEIKANGLQFDQVHWDARFPCLEQTVNNKAVGYSFRGQVNRSRGGFVRSPAISNQLFQKGHCFQFEQFGSCTKSACTSNTHAQNVSGNIPPVVAVYAHPTLKGVDAQLQHTHPTPINCETMAEYLVGYNKPDTSMLLDGFSQGFSLYYDGPHCIRFSGNHQSALQAPSLVDDKLIHEMYLGRIAGPFQQVPFTNFQVSFLGLVPKHEIGKFRLIHDL